METGPTQGQILRGEMEFVKPAHLSDGAIRFSGATTDSFISFFLVAAPVQLLLVSTTMSSSAIGLSKARAKCRAKT